MQTSTTHYAASHRRSPTASCGCSHIPLSKQPVERGSRLHAPSRALGVPPYSLCPASCADGAFGGTRLVRCQPHFCFPFSFSFSFSSAVAPAPAALAASSPRIFEAAMNLKRRDKVVSQMLNQFWEREERCHAVAALNSHPHAKCNTHFAIFQSHRHRAIEGIRKRSTHPPPHHAPKPRTYSACTAVMPTRFSISARCAFN